MSFWPRSLGCITTVGQQNWVLGLSRSTTFAPSGQWEPFTTTPTVVPVIQQGCYIQYHRLFEDEDGTYLEYWAGNDAGYMLVHQLVPGLGPLPIVANANETFSADYRSEWQ